MVNWHVSSLMIDAWIVISLFTCQTKNRISPPGADIQIPPVLNAEGAATAARFRCLRVIEHKAFAVEVILKVELGTREVHQTLRVDEYGDPA